MMYKTYVTCMCILFLSIAATTATAAASHHHDASTTAAIVNTRPILAILTLPCLDATYCQQHTQYFPASYSKYLEMAGARIVPLFYNSNFTEIDYILNHVNGVLFTGGDADLSDGSIFYETVKYIVKAVIQKNKEGVVFPLHGTCLGFESIVQSISQNNSILANVDAWNLSIALQPTALAPASRVFSAPGGNDALTIMSTQAVTLNNHHSAVLTTDFAANINLNSFFNVLAVNQDRNNVTFVSMMEGKQIPITGTQFHPEKNLFEWYAQEAIVHSYDAARAMQHIANVIVDYARRNNQRFAVDEENSYLLDNYSPTFTPTNDFIQSYYF